MSDNVSDIKKCLEYLEKHVGDDDEVEIMLYQEDEGDSIEDGDPENGDDDGVYKNTEGDYIYPIDFEDEPEDSFLIPYGEENALPTSSLSKKLCGATQTAEDHNTKIENNIDDPVSDYLDDTNDYDDSDFVETESNIEEISSSKPLGKYQCLMCPYNTNKKCFLRRHLKTHFDHRTHKCPVCERAFRVKEYLKIHLNAHMDIKRFQCRDCDLAFISSSSLGKHRRERHSSMKPLNCTECDYSTLNRSALKFHMTTHMQERPYKCTQCDYAATSSKNLKSHERVHTGEKHYECDVCLARYGAANKLRNHRLTHFKSGYIIECDICSAKMRNDRTLRHHMWAVHNSKNSAQPYKCLHCKRSFAFKAFVLRHMKTHDLNIKIDPITLNLKQTDRFTIDLSLPEE